LPPFIAPASSSVNPKPAHQPQRLEEAQLTGCNRRIAIGGVVVSLCFLPSSFVSFFFKYIYIYIFQFFFC
jgi:hypothetical protein